MTRIKLGDALAAILLAVAALTTLEALSMPVPDRRRSLAVVMVSLVLLVIHAGVYRFGGRIRERLGLGGYAALQAALIFGIALTRPPGPVTVGLFMAATMEQVLLAGARWGTVRITIGAIGLYVAAALLTSDLYRATAAGLMLAITGLLAHAIAALVTRPAVQMTPVTAPTDQPVPLANGHLSARELDVLRELVGGARNSEIATRLGITERTVKAHLGSIYQKLGVETRSAAVAAAVQRKIVQP